MAISQNTRLISQVIFLGDPEFIKAIPVEDFGIPPLDPQTDSLIVRYTESRKMNDLQLADRYVQVVFAINEILIGEGEVMAVIVQYIIIHGYYWPPEDCCVIL